MPYMAIETLKLPLDSPLQLHAGHDLESLLHTMLAICTYTTGPGGQLRAGPTKSNKTANGIKLNEWFSIANRNILAEKKAGTLEAFNSFIKPHLTEYWQDFAPYLERLINATWDKPRLYEAPNVATHKAYRDVLMDALDKYTQEEPQKLAVYAFVPKAKRPISDNFTLQQPKRTRIDDGTSLETELEPNSQSHGLATCPLDKYQDSVEQ